MNPTEESPHTPEPPIKPAKGTFLRGPYIVLAFGLLVLAAVLLSERKTALNSRNLKGASATRDGGGKAATPTDEPLALLAQLPPAQLNTVEAQVLRKLEAELATADANQAPAIYDKLITLLSNNGRTDLAALYAEHRSLRNAAETKGRKEAAQLYTTALSEPPAGYTPAQLQQLAGRAIAIYEELVKAEPTNTELQINLALAQVNSPQPMQGILKLRELAEQNPSNYRLHLQLGIFAIQTGQNDKAIERLNQALKANPQGSDAAYYLGVVHKAKGDIAQARKFASLSLETARTDVQKQQANALLRELNG